MSESAIPDDTRYAVLGAIVLKKMATAPAVAQATAVPVETVREVVGDFEASGVVVRAEDNIFSTEEAEKQVRDHADNSYGTVRGDPAVERWMARFETQNRHFLETISAWQQIDQGGKKLTNDHTDPEYDARILARVDATLVRVGKLLDELSSKVSRVARYGERLQEAFDKVDAGETKYLSDPTLDSVHNIWFEMHEDILLILGKERSE